MATSRGALLVLEGLDRVGKTTQCTKLAKSLQNEGVPIESIRFPDRTTSAGQEIDRILKGEREATAMEAHELFAHNRREWRDGIIRRLRSGITLVVDRYAFSGVAYTAAKGSVPLEECMRADEGMLAPDEAIFLTLEPSQLSSREGFGQERYEEAGFQENVHWAFLDLVRQGHLHEVSASGSEEEVAERVLSLSKAAVSRCSQGAPIRVLWDNRELDNSSS